MSGPETVDSAQVKLVRTILEGMKTGDVDLLAKPLHKDLRRITYPRSLGRPEYNKEDWLQQIRELFALLAGGCEASYPPVPDSPDSQLNPPRRRPFIPS
jgi:hypothetical protein